MLQQWHRFLPALRPLNATMTAVPEPNALVPSLPPVPRPLKSELAASLARDGYIICEGVITGTQSQDGANTATVNMNIPAFSRASQTTGGQACTITIDCETARYLPMYTRVELAIRVLGEEQ